MHVNFSDEIRTARWFAGKDRELASAGAEDAIELPAGAGRLVLVAVTYRDGSHERYLRAESPSGDEPAAGAGLWAALVDALATRGVVAGERGRLELRRGPAFERLHRRGAEETVVSLDQSNTLTALGGRLLVKAYRRLHAGAHPEVEACTALAALDAPVPAFAGAVVHVAADGAETAVALLEELVADAESGWETPIERLAAALVAGQDPTADLDRYHAAGAATGALQRALASALGTVPAPPGSGPARREATLALLEEACAVDTLAASRAAAARAALEPLAQAGGSPLQRVHGDLHIGQLLFSGDRVLVIDLEGSPLLDLEQRRAPDMPLRDIASLLRSIDHVASAAERRTGADAQGWSAAARDAALTGYAATATARIEPSVLRALEVASDLSTLVYAHRVLPEWAYAPRRGLERLLA